LEGCVLRLLEGAAAIIKGGIMKFNFLKKKELSPLEVCRIAIAGLTKTEKQHIITQLLKEDFPFMHIGKNPIRLTTEQKARLENPREGA
jgi:hypothetical protein